MAVTKLKIGHTRVSTGAQDLAARTALAVCRTDGTLIATKLDRLAWFRPGGRGGLTAGSPCVS